MSSIKNDEKLLNLIIMAIEDHKITNEEYDEVLMLAYTGKINDEETKRLLATFHYLIADKTIKRVP